MTQYEVARGSLKLPFPKTASKTAAPRAQFLRQGELIPEGLLAPEEITSLLADKRIAKVRGSERATRAPRPRQQRGIWSVDPESLKDKTLEELTLLVLGIDENFPMKTLKTKKEAIKQLTKDWDPAFADDVAKSYDRGQPGIGEEGAQSVEGGGHELSAKAQATLEKARQRAKGQTQGGEPEQNEQPEPGEDDDEG